MGEGKRALQVQMRVEVREETQCWWTPSSRGGTNPNPARASTVGERGWERWEGDQGSSPTQQLAQMTVEARPSILDGEEPVRGKLQPTMAGKTPRRNS